jgi:hypothetical protein
MNHALAKLIYKCPTETKEQRVKESRILLTAVTLWNKRLREWIIVPLSLIDIILVLDFFHSNFHTLLSKADVLLFHLLGRFVRDISHYCVNRIANEGQESKDYEEDDKRDELR